MLITARACRSGDHGIDLLLLLESLPLELTAVVLDLLGPGDPGSAPLCLQGPQGPRL